MLSEDRSFWRGLRNGLMISVWLWAFLLWLTDCLIGGGL
jgi:hypothetical protein